MGYGGALVWTGLLRNVRTHFPKKQVVFVVPTPWRALVSGKPTPEQAVLSGHPLVRAVVPSAVWPLIRWRFSRRYLVIDMLDTRYHYWTRAGRDHIAFKSGRHAIQYACDGLGIPSAELKPEIFVARAERRRASSVLEERHLVPRQYVCIEPHAKQTFSPNKAWFWDRWQAVADRVGAWVKAYTPSVRLAQVGVGGQRVLDGVVDLTGALTFREMAVVLESALGLITYAGGLMHLMKAVGGRSVVVMGYFEPRELMGYPDDLVLYPTLPCACRGWRRPCPRRRACLKSITVDAVVTSAIDLLRTKLPTPGTGRLT